MKSVIKQPTIKTVRVEKIEPGEYFAPPYVGGMNFVYRRLASLDNIMVKNNPLLVYAYVITDVVSEVRVVYFTPSTHVRRLRPVGTMEFELVVT